MCGIVGYTGEKQAWPILVEGLKRLEHRGYDSAGVAIQRSGEVATCKQVGKVADLENKLAGRAEFSATCGIAHTRWATHGRVSENNAHPHLDMSGRIALVHNGTIENFQTLRTYLEGQGIKFMGETDTEVLAKLIGFFYRGNLEQAVRMALAEVTGGYAIAVCSSDEVGKIVAANNGSELVFGLGDGEHLVASEEMAIVRHVSRVVTLEKGELVVMDGKNFQTISIADSSLIEKEIHDITVSLEAIERGSYPHFMLKEIMEQPAVVRGCLSGRACLSGIILGGLNSRECTRDLARVNRFILTGCGSALHAAKVGAYAIEQLAGIPVEIDSASELRYRNKIIEPGTAVVAISQSGTTLDTLEAVRHANERGVLTLGVVNRPNSAIAKAVKAGVYIRAGQEIGVASTKAYLAQVLGLIMIALFLGRRRILTEEVLRDYIARLELIPDQIALILKQEGAIQKVAQGFVDQTTWLFLGRGPNHATAMEGALKLKEITYLHAEGFPAGEMKHGPISLISGGTPVVAIATAGSYYDKMINGIQEVKARGAKIIAVATEGDEEIQKMADHIFWVPETTDLLQPLLTVVPLQLLAYHAALHLGRNVDQPRNLAKSVTVE